MSRSGEDWAAVLEKLLRGDRRALLKLTRLANAFLLRLRAYDFQDDWDDLIQEAIVATALAAREGRLRNPQAAAAYLRTALRFQFNHRLRTHIRHREDATLPWEDAQEGVELGPPRELPPEVRGDLHRALDELPEKARDAVLCVYLEGLTYDEAAERTGIPLGSLKRYLRDALVALRGRLAGAEGFG